MIEKFQNTLYNKTNAGPCPLLKGAGEVCIRTGPCRRRWICLMNHGFFYIMWMDGWMNVSCFLVINVMLENP